MTADALPQHASRELHRKTDADVVEVINFASARITRVASDVSALIETANELCLSTHHASCIQQLLASIEGKPILCLSTHHASCISKIAQR